MFKRIVQGIIIIKKNLLNKLYKVDTEGQKYELKVYIKA